MSSCSGFGAGRAVATPTALAAIIGGINNCDLIIAVPLLMSVTRVARPAWFSCTLWLSFRVVAVSVPLRDAAIAWLRCCTPLELSERELDVDGGSLRHRMQ